MMKKIALISLALTVLGGCQNTEVNWQESSTTVVAQTQIELKSSLWVDRMPTIGESSQSEENLHAAIYIESQGELPAELDINRVSIKQGGEEWLISSEEFDIRTHNSNQWEIAFVWQLPVNPGLPVDVALQLSSDGQEQWLVERDVNIDMVH
ncbi:hypothetical protein [Vibrio genomosp. F10]|uniref:DNA polymerase III subunit beta n=2 Tax=Vibrio genomosp. F10 TaxID=723171 RepID=A0A1B9QVM8_9VIBR|nr:hypothetical protein [Vibrio genomosp. F10]OCH73124.1 hypothetical protein A6E14_14920 [Vibrio genomosp. F10]OEE31620.1 hypothetical protein A1QO_02100 [Vibrio genomosp. F10 str. ZF-129]OEE96698.1 hypothetical protein A1QK_02135 [Vibrio genomosp. F10 str. 9ZD137]OEE97517.1 hypothetical protein A1QM_02670 [Vibrio genomosp. F10 str. 9ZC157]OEF09440.1 hypothetical protein A1QI_03390 [Vibrio genomosp. F10 str. 9ZB36]